VLAARALVGAGRNMVSLVFGSRERS